MSRVAIILAVAASLSLPASSQNQEYTTYFVEKNGYQIDFPAEWQVGVEEKFRAKRLSGDPVYISVVIGALPTVPYYHVMITHDIGCKSAKSEMKGFKSIFEKEAKKSKDDKYLVHSEGEGETIEKMEFNYMDYTRTFHEESGGTAVMRKKFYTACHTFEKLGFKMSFTFQAREEDWEKAGPMFDKMFNSIKYKAK